jgi:peroxiredoxin
VKHPARVVAGVVLVALIVLAVVLATRPPYQATAVDSPLLGRNAPGFTGTQLSGDSHVSLSSYRGHWVYLNFFASWCAPCQSEEPNLVQFNYEQSRATDGARMVSVVYQDSDSAALRFDKGQGADWPTISDPGGNVANAYGVSAPPTTFLIDPHGRVASEWVAPLTVSQLDKGLRQARQAEGAT